MSGGNATTKHSPKKIKTKWRIQMLEWIIRNEQNRDQFWNDALGWADWQSATRFPLTDYCLPTNGEWVADVTKILAMENTNA
jgi:hypothetical protein